MVSQVDQQRVCALLTEAVTVICKNGLTFNNKFCIEGLLGITMDDRNMFLVNIKETIIKGGGAYATNQNKSQSASKAGVFVGKPPVQSNGGRGGGPNGGRGGAPNSGRGGAPNGGRGGAPNGGRGGGPPMGPGMIRPRGAMNQGVLQQQLQRRRLGPPQPQVIPAKRPAMGMGPAPNVGSPPNVGRGSAPGGPSVGMPQEWAALIQLQQQNQPSMRGRGRATARRGGWSRGMSHRGGIGIPGHPVRTPQRRMSQSSVDPEVKAEMERKAKEQVRSRSERLQRRRSGGPEKDDKTSDTASIESVSPEKLKPGNAAMKDKPASEQGEEHSVESDSDMAIKIEDVRSEKDVKDDEREVKTEPSESDEPMEEQVEDQAEEQSEEQAEEHAEESSEEQAEDSAEESSDNVNMDKVKTEPEDKRNSSGGDKSDRRGDKAADKSSKEEGEETSKEGDGSWLLSNSSWLLGDLESMASNSEWKDSTSKGEKPPKS